MGMGRQDDSIDEIVEGLDMLNQEIREDQLRRFPETYSVDNYDELLNKS